ncbi:MAG: hypothetical protein MUC87_19940 [Bacteroidia bacterium]|jgi:hypothetical protein|nr:hypothetical protein [Bacteroidia bacterium]
MKILLPVFKLIPLPVTVILLAVPALWLLIKWLAGRCAEEQELLTLKKYRASA